MAGIIEVILLTTSDRRMLDALDDAASYGEDPCAGWMLAPVWCRLADLLELHAEAEELCRQWAAFIAARTRDATPGNANRRDP
jgi:hypothetical protein